MGRDYFGDINGRLWFAVQNSNAADRFGVTGEQPSELYYYFNKDDHLDTVRTELTLIKNKLGKNLEKLNKFFEGIFAYTDKQLADYLGKTEKEVELLLKDYADLVLGNKILKQLETTGSCEFTAEL